MPDFSHLLEPGRIGGLRLRAAGLDVRVLGDAGDLGYIEGAIHSAWSVAAAL